MIFLEPTLIKRELGVYLGCGRDNRLPPGLPGSKVYHLHGSGGDNFSKNSHRFLKRCTQTN